MDQYKINLVFPKWYRKNLMLSMLKDNMVSYRLFFDSNSLKIIFWYGNFSLFNELFAIYKILKSKICDYTTYGYDFFLKNKENIFNNEYVEKMINLKIIDIKYDYHIYSKRRYKKILTVGEKWEKFSKDINECLDNEIVINYLDLLEVEKNRKADQK